MVVWATDSLNEGRDRNPGDTSRRRRGDPPRCEPGPPGSRQAAGGAGAAPRGRLPRHGGLVSGRSVYRAPGVWPRGLWAAHTETPYRRDVARAKALLAHTGHGDGFALRIDTLTSPPFPAVARALRATFAEAGIDAQVVIWEGAELWPRYRAREHELILAPWSPDYVDPHSNADAFARNPDNRPEANLTCSGACRTRARA